MYTLGAITKRNIETFVSLPFSKLIALDPDDEHFLLESVYGERISFSTKRDYRKIGRGNPLLARKRFKTIEEVNKRLTEIYNANSN